MKVLKFFFGSLCRVRNYSFWAWALFNLSPFVRCLPNYSILLISAAEKSDAEKTEEALKKALSQDLIFANSDQSVTGNNNILINGKGIKSDYIQQYHQEQEKKRKEEEAKKAKELREKEAKELREKQELMEKQQKLKRQAEQERLKLEQKQQQEEKERY